MYSTVAPFVKIAVHSCPSARVGSTAPLDLPKTSQIQSNSVATGELFEKVIEWTATNLEDQAKVPQGWKKPLCGGENWFLTIPVKRKTKLWMGPSQTWGCLNFGRLIWWSDDMMLFWNSGWWFQPSIKTLSKFLVPTRDLCYPLVHVRCTRCSPSALWKRKSEISRNQSVSDWDFDPKPCPVHPWINLQTCWEQAPVEEESVQHNGTPEHKWHFYAGFPESGNPSTSPTTVLVLLPCGSAFLISWRDGGENPKKWMLALQNGSSEL